MRIYVRLMAALVSGACLLIGSGAAESAYAWNIPKQTGPFRVKHDVNVRAGSTTKSTRIGRLEKGERVQVLCQTRGRRVKGTKLWDYVQYQVDGANGLVKRGYVSDYYIKTGRSGPLRVRQGGCPPALTKPGQPMKPPNKKKVPAPPPVADRWEQYCTSGAHGRQTCLTMNWTSGVLSANIYGGDYETYWGTLRLTDQRAWKADEDVWIPKNGWISTWTEWGGPVGHMCAVATRPESWVADGMVCHDF